MTISEAVTCGAQIELAGIVVTCTRPPHTSANHAGMTHGWWHRWSDDDAEEVR